MKNYIAFGLGAAIGALITWKFVQSKYEQHAEDEIESVKEAYHDMREKDREDAFEEGRRFMEIKMDSPVSNENVEAEKKKKSKKSKKKTEKPVYEDTEENGAENTPDELIKQNVFDYSNISKNEKEVDDVIPRIITESEYDRLADDYECVTLTYYMKDGMLSDDLGNQVDIDLSVGREFITAFEQDDNLSVIFVRNDKREAVYDILREDDAFFNYPEEE